MEEWRPVIGFENIYLVSNLGNVKRVASGKGTRCEVLKPYPNADDYLCVSLHNFGRRVAKISDLVTAAFIGPKPEGLEVNHKDANRQNNRLDNLEYCTHIANIAHSFKLGAYDIGGVKRRGERNGRAKLTRPQVFCIRSFYSAGVSAYKLADFFHAGVTTVYHLLHADTWRD